MSKNQIIILIKKTLQMKFIPIFHHQQYKQKILPALQKLASKQLQLQQVLNVLRKFRILTCYIRKPLNPHQSILTFKALKKLYKHQIVDIVGDLAKVILQAKPKDIKILTQNDEDQITITKRDMMFLMSSMALNLIPFQQYDTPERRSKFCYTTDFNFIFQEEEFKTQTVIQYFKSQLKSNYQKSDQKFSIRRQVNKQHITQIIKQNYQLPMLKYYMHSDKASIQDFIGGVKVDFANKFIGGGALHSGCVQQEIMFSNHPELFTSTILCQVMNERQSLFFTGFKKHSKNSGYGWSTKYDGQQKLKYQMDNQDRFKEYIVAIDAIHFPKYDKSQFTQKLINRQLTKAFSGFNIPQKLQIITGNWGCGAFNGQVRLKFMIQWLACSLAKKQMVYCPYGSKDKIMQNKQVLQKLSKMKVGEVYELLINSGYCMKSYQNNIFDAMSELL